MNNVYPQVQKFKDIEGMKVGLCSNRSPDFNKLEVSLAIVRNLQN